MAVGFVRLAPSFLTLVEGPNLEKNPENEKLMTEFLPPEQSPGAKNPEFQTELTGLWFGYRYAIVRIRSTMVQQHAVVKEKVPGNANEMDFMSMVIALYIIKVEVAPLMLQLKQMINEMKGFEDRIVALMEEENPLPRVDTIQEMQSRIIVSFKHE